ncbi:MAG: hypothetical protein V2A55_02715 [Candidatus Jorgensenbacteria bacterium]
MKKIKLLAVASFVIVTFAETLSAQAFPMWRKSMSPAEVAEAIEDDDDTRLLATPAQILTAIRQALPEAKIEDISGLVAYLRSLEVRLCPRGEYQLSRILRGKLDWDFRRHFGVGEPCFFDRNLNKFVLSGSCGNVIAYDTVEPTPPQVEPTSPIPVYVSQTVILVADTTAHEEPPPQIVVKKEGDGWLKKVLIGTVAGATIYAAADYFLGGDDKPTDPPIDGGGPVNPPNRARIKIPISLPFGGR